MRSCMQRQKESWSFALQVLRCPLQAGWAGVIFTCIDARGASRNGIRSESPVEACEAVIVDPKSILWSS
jgi:hypothetical protein